MSSLTHVLDLPPLYTRPTVSTLLDALNGLAVQPASFDRTDETSEEETNTQRDALARYLTNVIASKLQWIEDDNLREEIWENASARLSERSGRSAMPSVYRTFKIPRLQHAADSDISIILREPSLTGDNLGHKTWAASYLLAKRLKLLINSLPCISHKRETLGPTDQLPETSSPPRILELGAGTGLVGIAAAAVFGAEIHLTDLSEICGNLNANCEANAILVNACGASTKCFPLDWANLPSEGSLSNEAKYDLVLASDPLYSAEHPPMLVEAITIYLSRKATARVVVELPLRAVYQPEVQCFRELMLSKDLKLVEDGEEVGYDDWDDGKKEVLCWWGIWAWAHS